MLFFDLETLCIPESKCIDDSGIACIAYVYLNGKSVIKGIIENREGLNPFFSPDFQSVLNQHDCLCGYNSRQFDSLILKANGYSIDSHFQFDLLQEIRLATGQPPQFFRGKTKGGYSLKSVANANGFLSKDELHDKAKNQSSAPALWENRQYKLVSDYCLKDVEITCQIYNRFIKGTLIDPTDGKCLRFDLEVSKRERLRWAELQIIHQFC